MARESFDGVAFDLDGTLIDHFTTIYRSCAYAMEQLGLVPADYSTVRQTVGGSIDVTMSRLAGAENREKGVALFREEFARIWKEDLRALPGASWILENLHQEGIRTAIFTNKTGDAARDIAGYLGFDRYCDLVIGSQDTPWRKPQAEFSREFLLRFGVSGARCILVGDSPWDVAAASAAEMPSIVVATGSHTPEQLAETEALGVFADMYALGETVFGLVAPSVREELVVDPWATPKRGETA